MPELTIYEYLGMGLAASAVWLLLYTLVRGEVDSYYLVIRMNRFRRSGLRLAILPVLNRITRVRRRILGDHTRYARSLESKIKRAHLQKIYDAEELISLQVFNALAGMLLMGSALAVIPIRDNTHFTAMLALSTVMVFALATRPATAISSLLETKKREMIKEWPFFMDLLTLAMDGGMDIITATRQIIYSSGSMTPLFEELREMLNEIELGTTRTDAMQNLCARIDSDAITSVINLMIQAEQLGMPIAPLMRAQAKDFRERRVQHVEKMAQEAPVKLMGPLLGCIFPAILLIMVGPLLLQYLASQ